MLVSNSERLHVLLASLGARRKGCVRCVKILRRKLEVTLDWAWNAACFAYGVSTNLYKIVVGVDGSPRQPEVLAAAVDLGLRFDAHLTLVRVIGVPPEIPAEAWQRPGMDLRTFLEQKARRDLDEAALLLPEPLRLTARLETMLATPWQGLCTTAECIGANLIMIGSHGYGMLDRVLGTTAARVVNHATCSVFVVRAAASNV